MKRDPFPIECECGCGETAVPPEAVVKAAETLRADFETAKTEGYYNNGWYARMSKWNIEALIEFVIGPLAPVVEKIEFTEVETAFRDGVAAAGGYVTGTGQVLARVHGPADCAGRGCVIHHPSDHHMRDWPTNWRTGGMLDIKPPHMERVCEHGIGHPDPDDITEGIGVHGCDGCCRTSSLDAHGDAQDSARVSGWNSPPPALHNKREFT